jgi:hypothetical protein
MIVMGTIAQNKEQVMGLPILIRLASMAGVAVAGGYAGYKYGTQSGFDRGLTARSRIMADEEEELGVEEEALREDDEEAKEE